MPPSRSGPLPKNPKEPRVSSMAKGVPCAGCAARESEIKFLRKQVDTLTARAFPAAPVAASPKEQEPMATWVDDNGVSWVHVYGRDVKLDDYNKMLEGQGKIDHTGAFVSKEEEARVAKMLDAAIGGVGMQS